MSDAPLIQLQRAQLAYQGSVVLSDINLCVNAGERIALVGRSGSGKSSLLRLVHEQAQQLAVALVPQDEGLVNALSVYHNVYMGQLAAHPSWYNLLNLLRPFPSRVKEVKHVLSRVKLLEKCFEPSAQLSGGQRQRTAVARALYQGGDLLLADEPVSAVDEQQAQHILTTLSETFPSSIIALHDTELALRYCDRIIGLEAGRIVLDQPSHMLSAAKLSALYDHSSS